MKLNHGARFTATLCKFICKIWRTASDTTSVPTSFPCSCTGLCASAPPTVASRGRQAQTLSQQAPSTECLVCELLTALSLSLLSKKCLHLVFQLCSVLVFDEHLGILSCSWQSAQHSLHYCRFWQTDQSDADTPGSAASACCRQHRAPPAMLSVQLALRGCSRPSSKHWQGRTTANCGGAAAGPCCPLGTATLLMQILQVVHLRVTAEQKGWR